METPPARIENLGLIFQEVLTAVVRIRAGRQAVAGADTFRAQVKEALRLAGEAARRAGYSSDHTRLAILAVVALLDETVLASRNPAFHDWARRPLQEELFGGHVAGETFYQTVKALLTAEETPDVADLLEIFELSLLLGYRGRYGAGGEGDLRGIQIRMAEKIARIRGGAAAGAVPWRPPQEAIPSAPGRTSRPYAYAALGVAALTVLLFAFYHFSIGSAVSALAARGS